jgi:hypothetical protein
VLLDRRERLTNPSSEIAGHLIQGVQNVFFSRSLYLLLVEDRSVTTVLCA